MGSAIFTLLLMIFLHIVDDYYLQGWLAKGKQRDWWVKNAPDSMYKNDYLWCLLMHSFSWTFMVMFPVFIKYGFAVDNLVVAIFLTNLIIHGWTDHQKANLKTFSLWQDQTLHMIQISCTWILFFT